MKLRLTGREKSELVIEGVITIILLLLMEMSLYILLNQLVTQNPGLKNGIFQIKMSLSFGPSNIRIWSWGWLFMALAMLVNVAVIYWRLIRRYSQMQLHHIIDELHYIAAGHLEHKIPFELKGPMQKVVESVNALVESAVNAMEEERRIERSKDELITNVSHDIRTPLTSIIGYLGLVENQQYQNETDLLKYTHTAYLKAGQMKALVDDLFEYTKINQIGAKLNLDQLDLGAMIEQLGASFELEAQKKQMEIKIDVPAEPLMIEADGEKLARVFNNLITNALKYGLGGHQIVLSAQQLSAKEVKIVVKNDGEPIPQASLSQVFDRFYRVESSRSKETGGTGLGLAITQGIVQMHQGYIYVTSDETWTSFIIHLPVTSQHQVKARN